MLTQERKNRFMSVISKRFQDVVVLENIHDPHNALAAIRNCDAFGIQTAHFIFETEKMFNPEKLGKLTSASANKWVDAISWDKTNRCLDALKQKGFKIVATVIDSKAKPLSNINLTEQKTAIMFGNEGFGISQTAKDHADEMVYIPMRGFVDSLNLSVTVGVMLYELYRQREKTNKFFLTREEQDILLAKWIDLEIKKKYRL